MTEQNTATGPATAPPATTPAAPAPEVPADSATAAPPEAPEPTRPAGTPAAPEGAETPASAEAPAAPAAPKDRRALRAALRWTAAVLVFAAAGAGSAYGITRAERTDLPGLSTRSDGRWTYPALAKPALPPGAPVPFAVDNLDGIHYAGLTQLTLPAPVGSSPDPGLKLEKDSAVTVDTFLEEYDSSAREKLKQGFADNGLRQIVARGWTTPDGTRTRVYLLRFHASGFADTFTGCGTDLNGVKGIQPDGAWEKARQAQPAPDPSGITVLEESVPFGDEQTRVGCVQSGDVQAVILQNRKGGAAAVPLHQAVILQRQLLG
ncbi:hypothetical protein [Streptomyces sp. NPDC001389]|uniref:hypothetical protein n=1 Tax=unclassified Streptomyces TaxID=2593676 RepID=UPI003692FB63